METIVKLWYYFLVAPIVFIVAPFMKKSVTVRMSLIVVHAVLLTFFTIFLFNQPFWRWSEQAGFIKEEHGETDTAAYKYVWDNFVLVDNSFDKVLLPNPEGDEDDSTKYTITNRQLLYSFLKLMNKENRYVDLVVFDIGLDKETEYDSLLKQEMLNLVGDNKLLLSLDPPKQEKAFFSFNDNVYGSIREQGSENLYVSHTVKDNDYYSLPYKLYGLANRQKKLDGTRWNGHLLREQIKGIPYYGMATFSPEFKLTNEKLLMGYKESEGSGAGLDIDHGYETSGRTHYFLSQPLADTTEFVRNLQQRKAAGKQNIIFMGSFASPEEDLHDSMYGRLHGPTILLNIFYALQEQQHYISPWFVMLLFGGYFLVTFVLVYRCLKLPLFGKKKEKPVKETVTIKKRNPVVRLLGLMLTSVLEFLFVEELHFVLLIGMLFLVKSVTGHLINVLSLLLWFGVLNLSFKYIGEKLHKEHDLTHK